jgi:ABC-type nitrate/sulfonate/bicarbonate transport system ATPase subunit
VAQHGFTVLLVTHDVSEAVAVADRVILIEDGEVGLDLHVDLPRPGRVVRIAWPRWKAKCSTVFCRPGTAPSRNL